MWFVLCLINTPRFLLMKRHFWMNCVMRLKQSKDINLASMRVNKKAKKYTEEKKWTLISCTIS